MKQQLPRRWNKWALLGIAFTIIVATAPSEGDISTAKTLRPTLQQTANAATSSSGREMHRLPEVAHVELERLVSQQSQPQPGAAVGRDKEAVIGKVFTSTSWYVPPPPPPPQPPAPPPAPSAPPIPFSYLGRYEDAPTRLVILVNGERMYTVAEGDVIENTYRIERVTAGQVELTYLPLNIKQTLSTGEAL